MCLRRQEDVGKAPGSLCDDAGGLAGYSLFGHKVSNVPVCAGAGILDHCRIVCWLVRVAIFRVWGLRSPWAEKLQSANCRMVLLLATSGLCCIELGGCVGSKHD